VCARLTPLYFENHRRDARVTGPRDTAMTLTGWYGTGGGNTPIVLNDQGGGDECHSRQNRNTPGNVEPSSDNIKTYGISSDRSNGMLSDNPFSGIYKADTSRTLDTSGCNPACNQGGIAVCQKIT
jgi:DNA (cytosine-5)-methyltransferase 1